LSTIVRYIEQAGEPTVELRADDGFAVPALYARCEGIASTIGMSTNPRLEVLAAPLLDCSLRVDELCTLTLQKVHLTPQDAWLLVHGKRDK
jgi:hypothetical protein